MPKERRIRRSLLSAGLCALLLATVVSTPMEQTEASWADAENTTGQLTVATLPSVPNFACTADGNIFTWSTPPAPYPGAVLSGYELAWVQTGTSNIPSTMSLPATATSATIQASVLTLLASYRVTLTAKYTNWVTPPASRTVNVLLGLLGIKLFTCGA